ncbi:ABC transporter permease, partial [Cellulomonas carbonis]
GVWQVASLVVGHALLLASPVDVVARLGVLATTGEFWLTVAHTLARVAVGFGLGVVVGTAGAAVASTSRVVDALTAPLMSAIRSVPVVGIVVLLLLWADSARLAAVVSFLMVLPIVWTSVREGVRQRDRALLEVAEVFRVPLVRRLAAVDLPAVLPHLAAACSIGIGLAWKSGVAAEVIGMPDGSVGEQMQQARVLLSSADLLAWTVVVVVAARVSELAVRALLRRVGGARTPGSRPGDPGSPAPRTGGGP